MFERGDLVKAKEEWTATFDNRYDLGVVLAVEKDFYQHNGCFQDRLTIHWTSGEKSQEPAAWMDKPNKLDKKVDTYRQME